MGLPVSLPSTGTLQLSLVYDMYKAMLREQYPVYAEPDTPFTSTPAIGLMAQVLSLSTSYIEISPELTVSFEASGERNILVYVPVTMISTTANTVISFGLYVDNVLDTNSEVTYTSTTVSMQTTYGNSYIHLLLPLSAGVHVIKPVMKVVSGASGNVIARYTAGMRTIVKEV